MQKREQRVLIGEEWKRDLAGRARVCYSEEKWGKSGEYHEKEALGGAMVSEQEPVREDCADTGTAAESAGEPAAQPQAVQAQDGQSAAVSGGERLIIPYLRICSAG